MPLVSFCNPEKSQCFSDVFREYRTVAWNGWNKFKLSFRSSYKNASCKKIWSEKFKGKLTGRQLQKNPFSGLVAGFSQKHHYKIVDRKYFPVVSMKFFRIIIVKDSFVRLPLEVAIKCAVSYTVCLLLQMSGGKNMNHKLPFRRF